MGDGEALAVRWDALRTTTPGLRTRDAAARLGVSEAELIASTVGATATRLDTDAAALLHALPRVGRCMALTRNEHAVSEVRGRYGGVELGLHAGQVVGEHIDLRVFLGHWRHAFAIDEPHDAAGETIALVFRKRDDREHAEAPAWRALLDRLPEPT